MVDELSLIPGDIVKPLEQLEPGWWIGQLGKIKLINNLNFILVDECNRKFGYESPKVIINVIS